jgi:hypothetical protein
MDIEITSGDFSLKENLNKNEFVQRMMQKSTVVKYFIIFI